VIEEEEDDGEGVDDTEVEAEAEAEAALVDGARDGEGADEELPCVADSCEERGGRGEETRAGLNACVFASEI
jgi:hypothetical protein